MSRTTGSLARLKWVVVGTFNLKPSALPGMTAHTSTRDCGEGLRSLGYTVQVRTRDQSCRQTKPPRLPNPVTGRSLTRNGATASSTLSRVTRREHGSDTTLRRTRWTSRNTAKGHHSTSPILLNSFQYGAYRHLYRVALPTLIRALPDSAETRWVHSKMTVETLTTHYGTAEHIIRPEHSLLQKGTDEVITFCGLSYENAEGGQEYGELDDVEAPCNNCLDAMS